ncbi:PHP domain-containing protein [Aminithiophilus ramosus]|uniref:PHP domain-containing protein n=2 Tax=Synergistales TaxID=649776 RepID=A0A9Q7ADI7_9BACT|nr:PHP domain-containing protein [Aminithiophilus ramosus]QTX31444.1 PHP domain-containing protein [Aminithiophilus ramosus]QVL35247.1 PHP domain-containing protein [Synergistota bacterium]
MVPFQVDLHVHTVLSPCGELEMGAPEIVEKARAEGIDILAVTDHNAADNVPALREAAGDGGPLVIAGIEVQTAEDIHVVTLFRSYGEAADFQGWLWKKMGPVLNDPDYFGWQVVIDGTNEVVRMEDRLLVQAVGYSVDEVVAETARRGGLSVMAHIDRSSFSYPVVLGPIPDELPVDALEVSRRVDAAGLEAFRRLYPRRVFTRASDAHRLDDLQARWGCRMLLEEPSFDELALALRGQGGRKVLL